MLVTAPTHCEQNRGVCRRGGGNNSANAIVASCGLRAARRHLERLHDGPPGLLGEPVARLGGLEELHLKRVHPEPAAGMGLAAGNLAPTLRPIGELHKYRTPQKQLASSQKLASPMQSGLLQ